jgi:hypothetical protein
MGWVEDTTERWTRIVDQPGDHQPSVEERVRVVADVIDPLRLQVRVGDYRRRGERAAADDTMAAAMTAATLTLKRHLAIGAMAVDRLVWMLREATGRSAEAIVADLSAGMLARDAEEVAALERNLPDSHARMGNLDRATYVGLSDRVTELLELAQRKAATIVEEARAEAERIKAEDCD